MAKKDGVAGTKILEVRPMTNEEMEQEGWEEVEGKPPIALVLSNGSVLYPSCDSEGNRGGVMFGYTANGERFCIF